MKKWMKPIVLLAFALSLCFIDRGEVRADEGQEYSNAIPKVTILECSGADYKTIQIMIKIPANDDYDYEIYRLDAGSGTYRLLDTVKPMGSTWRIYDGYRKTSGQKQKIECYKTNKEYYFLDTTAKFGQSYEYKIRLKDWEFSGDYSDPRSASPKLENVRIAKGYADLSGKIKLSWLQVNGAQGYQVYRKDGTKWRMIKRVKKGNKTEYTDRSVKRGKTYQYKVCAYRKLKGKKVLSGSVNTYKVTVKNAKIKGSYTPGSVYGPALNAQELQEVRRAVQSFKTNYIRKGMSDYEKVEAAYNFLRATCTYAYRGWQYNRANTAWGALVYGEAQCSGYARGFKALCDGMGIQSYYVHANAKSFNPEHQWNQVRVKGKWYILDAQGGFFLVSGKSYQGMTGMQWDKAGLPACKSDYKK